MISSHEIFSTSNAEAFLLFSQNISWIFSHQLLVFQFASEKVFWKGTPQKSNIDINNSHV